MLRLRRDDRTAGPPRPPPRGFPPHNPATPAVPPPPATPAPAPPAGIVALVDHHAVLVAGCRPLAKNGGHSPLLEVGNVDIGESLVRAGVYARAIAFDPRCFTQSQIRFQRLHGDRAGVSTVRS